MSGEIYQMVAPLIIALFFFWLLYRIKIRIGRIFKEKIIGDFPYITSLLDSFQKKIDYFHSRLDSLEKKVNEIENKIK